MCEVTRYFQTPPHLEIAKFSQNLPSPGALSTLCTVVKHLKNAIQGFRGALDLNYSEHAGLVPTPQSIPLTSPTARCTSFAYVGPSDWNSLPHSLHLELLSLSSLQPQR